MTYTKKDIEKWFDWMIEKYPNCNFHNSLISVRDAMFDEFWKRTNIDTYLTREEEED